MTTPTTDNTPIVAFTIDFETGGLKCQTSDCTQIAIHATRLDTFEKIGSYVSYIQPYDRKDIKGVGNTKKVLKSKYDMDEKTPMDYEDKALEYSAITMDMLYDQGKPIEVVGKEVCEFIASMINEVKKHLRGHEDFYGHWHPLYLDTITIGQLALCHQPNMNSYKLEIMCESLGVELDDAHDADADVSATTNVAMVLTKRMRSLGGDDDDNTLAVSKAEKSRKHFKI